MAPDRLVDDGDTVRVGALTLDVIHLRGHTPGGWPWSTTTPDGARHLFTGDSLFPGGVGKTWQDPAKFAELIDDVERKVFAVLPDETWVYPGHGDDTTLGRRTRPTWREWRARGW